MNEYEILWASWGILNYERWQWLHESFDSLQDAWISITSDHLAKMGFGYAKVSRLMKIKNDLCLSQIVECMENKNIILITINDSDYPKNLAQICNPPPFLFIRGIIPSLHKTIGVVGTRQMTQYGKWMTEKLVEDLVRNQFAIISGLALGVDTCAHQTTIRAQGGTIGVLGCGVDQIYPRSNYRLAQDIIGRGGAIISEYPLGTPPMAHHFPERNRIITGLSRGVLVIEGSERSGALITARLALEEGRDVFAIPKSVTNGLLSGTNLLIKKGEAKLTESVNDILDEWQMKPIANKVIINFNSDEKKILSLISKEPLSMDDLMINTSYSIANLSNILLHLQLKQAVREVGTKWVLY